VGTGLIYGAIVVVWAVFLVPYALRRYDEAAHTRSIEKFSTAMRVLGRRDHAEPAAPAPALAPPSPTRTAARVAAQRRRRTLLLLLGVCALVIGLGVTGLVPIWAAPLPVVLVGGFLVACRRQVRRENDAQWTQRAERPSTTPRRGVRVDSAYGGTGHAVGDEPDDAPTVVLSGDALVESEAVAVPVGTSDGRSLWDPLPVTLPTYVSKPRVARSIRTIDLGEPGTWTSGHVADEQTAMPESEAPESEVPEPEVPEPEVSEPEVPESEPRRAVGS